MNRNESSSLKTRTQSALPLWQALKSLLDKDFIKDVSLTGYTDEILLNEVDGMTDLLYERQGAYAQGKDDAHKEDAQLMVDAGILTPEKAAEFFKVPKREILPRNRWLKEQLKMDFKKCSEVYGYKSIAEVEEEELAEKIAQRDRDWIEAMFANPKFTDEDISSISGVPLNEIQKRRAQH